MKQLKTQLSHRSTHSPGSRESVAFIAAVCAVSGANAQENAAEENAETATSLPPQVVEAAKPAPAPAPRPRPVVTPPPAPVPAPEPEPLVLDDNLYKVDRLATTKYTTPLRDVPQTVQIIPESLTKDQAATTLRDVLRNSPGITVSAGEGGGGAPGDSIRIRGFSSRSDIFVDGARDYGVYNRDPFNYDRVEVYKGPSSSNTGRGSAGGSINLVTKTPRIDDDFSRAAVMVGSDSLFRSTIDINQQFGEGSTSAFRLNTLYHDQEVPGYEEVDKNRWGVAPSIAFGLGTDTRLTLTYMHFEEDNIPDAWLPYVPLNAGGALAPYAGGIHPQSYHGYYGLNGVDFEDITTDIAGVLFEHDFSDEVKMRNFTRYSDNSIESTATAPRFINAAAGSTAIRRELKAREQSLESWSNATDFTVEFDTGEMKHTVVAGFEFASEKQLSRTVATPNGPDSDLFIQNPNDPYVPAYVFGPPVEATVDTGSAYLFDTVEITENLKYIGGLRYDNVDMEVGTVGRTDDFVAWRSALVYNPAENGSVYFSYGTSFSPSADSVNGLGFGTRDENNNNINLADIAPEESQAFELGTKWDLFDDRISLTGALFRTEKTNARTVDLGVVSLNGEQLIQGFEFGAAGEITDGWNIFAGYVYTDSEIIRSGDVTDIGKRVGDTPLQTFNLWSVHDLPGGFQVGLGSLFVDDRVNNLGQNYQVDSYWLFDAMVSYEVSQNCTLRLNVHNLADEDYADRLGGNQFVPGAARSVSLSAEIEF